MTDPLRPDEVISPGGGSAFQIRKLTIDTLRMLPNLIKLLARLIADPRVPRRSKLVVGAAMAYLASPIDLIPDLVPVIGVFDDILVAALAVNHLIQVAGEEVVLEHWDGPRDLLDLVRSVLDIATDLVPPKVRRLFRGLSGT